jgi:hypothetical protein
MGHHNSDATSSHLFVFRLTLLPFLVRFRYCLTLCTDPNKSFDISGVFAYSILVRWVLPRLGVPT